MIDAEIIDAMDSMLSKVEFIGEPPEMAYWVLSDDGWVEMDYDTFTRQSQSGRFVAALVKGASPTP